jgi:DNA-binding HxlR family transcriptional regulator
MSPEQIDNANQGTVLAALIYTENQRPWSMEEIVREIGDEIMVTDAIANLRAAGLVHRTSDNFVFATRAAVHHDTIA